MSKQLISKRIIVNISLCLLLQALGALAQQQTTPRPVEFVGLSEAAINRVPADLRDQARTHVRIPETGLRWWLTAPEEELRLGVFLHLSTKTEAADFLLDKLPKELSAKLRSIIITNMPGQAHWYSHPRAPQVLATIVASDPDPEIVTQAIDSLRRMNLRPLTEMLTKRLEAAQRSGDQKMVKELAQEQERWISLEKGVMLPAFLRVPPPQFSLKAAGQSVRVVVFGDFGYGSDNQKKVATAIAVEHQKKPFDFGLTTGDNFYGSGMHSTDDPRWKTWWEELYGPLGIKFYATLGNHDWYHPDSPAAEILYSQKSPTWRMPAPYYTFTAGSAQFFAIDTNDISEAQASWLREELEKSRARWKVVYGHYPIYHAAPIGDNIPEMTRKLFPILRERADLYLAGHHHSLQHLKPEGGVHFIISGTGGASSYTVNEQEPRALFAKSVHGFTVLEATERELTIKHIGADTGQLYTYTLRK